MPHTKPRNRDRPDPLERAGDWLNRHPGRNLAALVALYLLIVVAQSLLKLLWADELITYYISRQPGLGGIWHALAAGADPNPPLIHVLVKASTSLLGSNAFAMRLPPILCVLLAVICIWWILRRWVAPQFALAGALAFMASRGFDYAYDARSYAPMMGFAMLSLALWIKSGDLTGLRRLAILAAMALALAAGISSNYYCVLAFFPIALGEVLRQRIARRFRPDIWITLAVAGLPLFAFLPLIRHNIAEFSPHAWNRPQPSMIVWSYLELVEGIFWPVLFLALYAWWHTHNSPAPASDASAHPAPFSAPSAFRFSPVSDPELAALGVLLLYPFLGFAIAIAGAGMISPRCVAPVCCAFGLAAGLLAARIFATKPRAAAAVVLTLALWVTVRESICGGVLYQQRKAFLALRDEIAGAPSGQFFVADSSFVLPLYFYSDDQTRKMIAFPIDFAAIHRFERDDSGEQNLWAGRRGVFPFAIGTPQEVSNSNRPTAYVIGRPDGWLAQIVASRGLELIPYGPDQNWSRVGGVFTPMAHPETRILLATKPGR